MKNGRMISSPSVTAAATELMIGPPTVCKSPMLMTLDRKGGSLFLSSWWALYQAFKTWQPSEMGDREV